MEQFTIGFIGAGNMATSLIGGLVEDGISPASIDVSDHNPDSATRLHHRFGVRFVDDNRALVEASDVVVLAVKPQVMQGVCNEIAEITQQQRPLLISVAAGIRSDSLDEWLGGDHTLVRTMPNTPALIQTGATALFGNARVDAAQRERAEAIMRAVGLTLWVEQERDLDAVTALSGSGPAYLFRFIESLQQGGEALGLSAETARLLALQTAFGATKMALESRDDCATLRRQVTSPGGTTERALQALEAGGFEKLVGEAMTAARDRARELGDDLAGSKR